MEEIIQLVENHGFPLAITIFIIYISYKYFKEDIPKDIQKIKSIIIKSSEDITISKKIVEETSLKVEKTKETQIQNHRDINNALEEIKDLIVDQNTLYDIELKNKIETIIGMYNDLEKVSLAQINSLQKELEILEEVIDKKLGGK